MQSTIKKQPIKKPKLNFPCLLKYTFDNVIILATGYTEGETGVTGTCVHTGSNDSIGFGEMRIGVENIRNSQSWTIHGTVLCNDAIELSN